MKLELTSGQVALVEVGVEKRRFSGEVESFNDDSFSINLSASSDMMFSGELVLVSLPDDYGVVRVEGVGNCKGNILEVTPTFIHERQQRRSHVRAKVELPVRVVSLEGEAFVHSNGITVDLSRGGLRAQLESQLPEGEAALVLDINGGSVKAIARIHASDNEGLTRMEFLNILDDGLEHILAKVMSATVCSPGARKISRLR